VECGFNQIAPASDTNASYVSRCSVSMVLLAEQRNQL
jgi:hypothetical protein